MAFLINFTFSCILIFIKIFLKGFAYRKEDNFIFNCKENKSHWLKFALFSIKIFIWTSRIRWKNKFIYLTDNCQQDRYINKNKLSIKVVKN